MSRGQIDRRLAPLSFGTGGADRWDLIDPELIVATASPRHQQSVLEDARATVRQLVGALRFSLATLLMPEGNRGAVHVREAEEAARRAIAWATGSGALPVGLLTFSVWKPCATDKPDADVDVLLSWGDGTPGAVGAWTGVEWIGPEGEPLDPPPVLWTDVPNGPHLSA